ncbi:uncharacterized protein LOC128177509 [Crassostrea angulata]|uniref:uncharacterized protein LOC128177509 n=1 Tax=Magallana angulata TaxID=2784310 RepID=UPI0022B1EEA7|nr:uncharacterized protein LOC128177509 [Crassostrea angulata]XP_052700193.1 uncharacterized protein LOC128177509 [Crassostrea angulata]
MNPLTVFLLCLFGVYSGCNGQQEDPCLALYTDGMRKCFSDITGLPSDDVKDVLMDEQQNAGTIKTICSKDAKMIECIETMTADTSKSSVCGEQNGLMKIAMITTSLKYKVDTLCGPGTPPQTVSH